MIKHTLVFHLLGVSKKLQKSLGYKSQPFSLSFSQARALLVIDSQREISQKEISERLQLEPASIVTLIDELEKLKLVERKTPRNNRRKYHIEVTPKGKKYVLMTRVHTNELESYIRNKLTSSEANGLFASIEKLNSILDSWQGHQTNIKRKEVLNELPSAQRNLAS